MVLLNVVATASLVRTTQLTAIQKIIQSAVVWLIPLLGARLVLHLLDESDPDVVRHRWIPNDTINAYVFQALNIEAQAIDRAVEQEIEQTIYDSASEHVSHSADGHSGGGDGH